MVLRLQSAAAMQRDPQAGMTLLELMAVMVILAILAAVAVGAYTKRVRAAKAGEVPQMLGEFQTKEEAYLAENGAYLSTGASDADFWHATLKGDSRSSINPMPTTWAQLGIKTGQNGLYCGYVAIAGAAGVDPTGDGATLWTATPTRSWYYVRAECDWNSKAGDNNVWLLRGDEALNQASQTNEGR